MTTILTCMWLLMLVTFSMPGREGPLSIGALDWIAILKVGTRILVFGLLASVVFRHWRTPRRREVVRALWPFLGFVVWALASVLWSPLPAVSLGQAFTAVVLFLLAAAIAMEWRDVSHTGRVLTQLTMGCLAVSVVLLSVHVLVGGSWSGLDRSWVEGGGVGLLHPTSAGGTASLGLVALAAVALIWGWPWSRAALWLAVPVHAAVLLMALSRMSVGLAVLMVALLVVWRGRGVAMAAGVAVLSATVVIYLVADPELALASGLFGAAAQYASRGESAELMWTLTGRTELWQVVWASFLDSPLIGYGYHVASSDGVLDVWGQPAVRSAHNLALHILVSTGLLGLGLFTAGLFRPIRLAVAAVRRDGERRRLGRLMLILGGWFALWSLLSESFMGPLQPESVVFFAVLGLAVGQSCERS